eukprot:5943061-Pyramimonas_sp.AAC.1
MTNQSRSTTVRWAGSAVRWFLNTCKFGTQSYLQTRTLVMGSHPGIRLDDVRWLRAKLTA